MYAAYAPIYQAIGQAWVGLRALATVQGWLAERGISWRRAADMGCGAGDCAIQLALQGCAVIGIDQSAAMLDLAERQAAAAGASVEWRHGLVTDWEPGEPLDGVVSFYDTLNYLTEPADFAQACAAAGAALAPGGVFAFDLNAPREYESWVERATVTADTERHFVYNVLDFDPESGLAEGRIVWFERAGDGWRRGEETHRQRGYGDGEVAAALAGAGLEIAARLTLDGAIADPIEATRILYIARKPPAPSAAR
ncbi:MAG TPA: class I SAM-dependent methyltransferase [Herpetosiphonaceae bacterium]